MLNEHKRELYGANIWKHKGTQAMLQKSIQLLEKRARKCLAETSTQLFKQLSTILVQNFLHIFKKLPTTLFVKRIKMYNFGSFFMFRFKTLT